MELEKVLENLEDSVSSELEKLAKKGELNPAEIKNATDALCLLAKIKMVEDGDYSDEEYSEADRSYRGSYARGRSYRNRRYSNGSSRHSINDRIVDQLERMMDSAGSEYERNVLSGWIAKVEAE